MLYAGLCFNSQRDGILPSFPLISLARNAGFNSQRDGILPPSLLVTNTPKGSFNSQRDGILRVAARLRRLAKSVSIPNGMEFYRGGFFSRRCIHVSIPNGMEFYFARSDYRKNRALVSIPNGMEFYRIPKKDDIFPFRFNSQRDGILLKTVKNILAKLHGFNSQRDGILRSQRRHKGDAYKLFQFPAGWNSTAFVDCRCLK